MQTKSSKNAPNSQNLPFVSKEGPVADFWSPPVVQGYAAGCALGSVYAETYLGGGASNLVPPLAFIIAEMVRKGAFGGIEAGFVSAIEKAARRGSVPRSVDLPDDPGLHNGVVKSHCQIGPRLVRDQEAGLDVLPKHKDLPAVD